MNRQYPRLVIRRDKLRSNFTQVITRCAREGISVAGVIKGIDGLEDVARLYKECGAAQLASSRLEQLERWRQAGIPGPYLLLRVPGPSELGDLVRLADYSLQSEVAVLRLLETECARQGKEHRAIIMADLGDLREGFYDPDELVDACLLVERELPHVILAGIGVNLGCYGAVMPTPENLGQLAALARRIEQAIGRKLEIVSGGASSSFPLVNRWQMPEGINHLRIGECALLAKDLLVDWGLGEELNYLQRGTIRLQAELIEVRTKPTMPAKPTVIDSFGNHPTFTDRGIRKRALAAFGRADVGDAERLICREPGMQVISASSDHCILDVEDCPRALKAGDIVEFDLCYGHMLFAASRYDMPVVFRDGDT